MSWTLFSTTGATDGPSASGDSIRSPCAVTLQSGAQANALAVTFNASSVAWVVAHASIGIQLSVIETTTTPVELTFSGQHGFSISAGASITSDFVSTESVFGGVIGSQSLIVIVDITTGAGSRLATTVNPYYTQTSSSTYNVANPSGFTIASNSYYGFNVVLSDAVSLTVPAGSYSISGLAVTFRHAKFLVAILGSYASSGLAITNKVTRKVTATAGVYAITGIAAVLKSTRTISLAVGSYVLTGKALLPRITLVALAGAYAITGGNLLLVWNAVNRNPLIRQAAFVLSQIRSSLPSLSQIRVGAPELQQVRQNPPTLDD